MYVNERVVFFMCGFLAHMGVQRQGIWNEWKKLATRRVTFVVCREQHKEAQPDELVYNKFDALFDSYFKIRQELRLKNNGLYNEYSKLPLRDQKNALLYVMRYRRSLELGSYVMDYSLQDSFQSSDFGLHVPLSLLVPSEWGSPEIALNTAAALKFAVENASSDMYWIVSGFDIPVVHPDNVQPFIEWSKTPYGLRMIPKQLEMDVNTLLRDTRISSNPTLKTLRRVERAIDEVDRDLEEELDDLLLNRKNTKQYKAKRRDIIKEYREREPLLAVDPKAFELVPFFISSGLNIVNELEPVVGSQWMCLIHDDARAVGNARDNLLEWFTFQYYSNNYSLKKAMNRGIKNKYRWKVADETFIHTILAHKYGEQVRKMQTSYMPHWIPWDSNTLTDDPDSWLVDHVNPSSQHTKIQSDTPLTTILQYEYYNSKIFHAPKEVKIVCYRKVGATFPLNGKDFAFLRIVWEQGFDESSCEQIYNNWHGTNLIAKEDLRAKKGDRFVKLRL